MHSGKLAPFRSYSSLKVPQWYKDGSPPPLPFNFQIQIYRLGGLGETDHTLQHDNTRIDLAESRGEKRSFGTMFRKRAEKKKGHV